MTKGKSLEDIVSGAAKLTEADAIKAYFMTIVSAQQKELQKTKAMVDDFRAIHNFDNLYEKTASVNALIDPVINCEILHLKRMLHEKDEELKAANDALEAHRYNPQSAIGATLLERCKLLITENEELGRIVLENQVQPLTLDLYKEREATKVLKKQLKALHQYNAELETETELMSKTIAEHKVELATLKKEYEAMAQKLQAPRSNSPSHKTRYLSPARHMREENCLHTDKSKRDIKSLRDDKEIRDDRIRKDDKRDKYSTRKDDKYENDKRSDRHDVDKKGDRYPVSKDSDMKRNDKYSTKRDDRHSTSRKEDKHRRDDSRGRSTTKRYREESRSRASPYRNRSPKSLRSRRY
ncbi:negative elongation factor E [Babesia ovis]|uniref:Negative elongation factor E n=1 Tax=Babesia ovis TaxID=5869 RepID=A0A9W5WW43_BABOV|nr:negative elongation factor E [Babesia ovis]